MSKLQQKTIEQLFAVLKNTKAYYIGGAPIKEALQKAINEVSTSCGIAYQTIGDLCRRRLKLDNIGEFHDLLRKWFEGDPSQLLEVIKQQTSTTSHGEINAFFFDHELGYKKIQDDSIKDDGMNDSEVITFRLDFKTAEQLRELAERDGQSIAEWLKKTVSELVSSKMEEWLFKRVEQLDPEQRRGFLKKLEKV